MLFLTVLGILAIQSVYAIRPEDNFDNDLLALYADHKLPYSCLPYIRKANIAVCDCMACSEAEPKFKERMCKFYEEVKKKGKADLVNRELVSACGFEAQCPQVPLKCCNPENVSEKKVAKGCALCRPASKSTPLTEGLHASCKLAEYEVAHGRLNNRTANWHDFTIAVTEAMKQAKLHPKCVSYPLLKNAKLCDCEDCLQNETNLRDKLCAIAEKIRSNDSLGRKGFFVHNEYYKKFCDKRACPSIPNKCCAATGTGDQLKTDRNGCPTCIPTTSHFGYGPRCRAQFNNLPQPIKLKVYGLP